MKKIFVLTILCAASFQAAFAAEPVKPAPRDKCPVCGMFVAKYPDFVAEIIYKDGSYAVFDGAKDMFRYYFDLKSYAAAKKAEDIESIYVTDYYSLRPIDAAAALYVVGSDVTGPMGAELIPFQNEEDAAEFVTDHGGKKTLRFKEVTPEIIKPLL